MPMMMFPTTDELSELVSPEKIAAQGYRKPKRVIVEEIEDHDGKDAYDVWVAYPNNTPDSELAYEKVRDLNHWITDQISKEIRYLRFPYVHIKRIARLAKYLRHSK